MNIYKEISDSILSKIKEIPEIKDYITPQILNNIAIEIPKVRDFGDFSTNIAMLLTKSIGKKPRDIAEIMVPYLEKLSNVANVSIAGPGFINLKLKDEYIKRMALTDNLNPDTQKIQKIDLDYGGYNVGKTLHIGHLRTTVVGDTFNRIARFLGHKTKSYNHMGDWGRPMGLIIAWILENGMPQNVDDVNRMYPASSTRAKEDPGWLEKGQKITVELQSGNEEYKKIYDTFIPMSLNQVNSLLKRLNILTFDENKGERLIAEYVPEVQEILDKKGIIEHSDGAEIISVKQDTDTEPMPPVMWKSSAGAQTYAAADLTAIYYRERTDNPDAIVYFTDNRQTLHFKQIFRAARLAGFADGIELQHIGFGTITGADGKPFKTRDGNVPSLDEMLNIVADSVRTRVKESGKQLPNETIEMIALAALKFNDLMHDVKSDYIFDVDSVTSFEGRTGPYILYTAVRLNSIIKKAEGTAEITNCKLLPEERDLLMFLLDFNRIIEVSFERRAPYILANYAYDLCKLINTFYHTCPIMRDDIPEDVKSQRLAIVKQSLRVLSQALDLMGLKIPEEM